MIIFNWIYTYAFVGDMTVGKTAICHVAGNEATSFPKTYNCVSFNDV